MNQLHYDKVLKKKYNLVIYKLKSQIIIRKKLILR